MICGLVKQLHFMYTVSTFVNVSMVVYAECVCVTACHTALSTILVCVTAYETQTIQALAVSRKSISFQVPALCELTRED